MEARDSVSLMHACDADSGSDSLTAIGAAKRWLRTRNHWLEPPAPPFSLLDISIFFTACLSHPVAYTKCGTSDPLPSPTSWWPLQTFNCHVSN